MVGTVRKVVFEPYDGDVHIDLQPDDASLLSTGNDRVGRLSVLEVEPLSHLERRVVMRDAEREPACGFVRRRGRHLNRERLLPASRKRPSRVSTRMSDLIDGRRRCTSMALLP